MPATCVSHRVDLAGFRHLEWGYGHVRTRIPSFASCIGLAILSTALAAADAPPATTDDGLELRKSEKTRIVYVRPGADFSKYQRVGILDCEVDFEKDWQKDYNSSRHGLEDRVKDSDIERMKAALAAECKKVFSEELQKNDGYGLSDVVGPDVLLLRPGLVNVEVNAPDLMTAQPGATIVRSAGQMTLILELWDPESKTILARVMDAQADHDGFARRANRVTNKAAADEILRNWAVELRKHLDAVRQPAPTAEPAPTAATG